MISLTVLDFMPKSAPKIYATMSYGISGTPYQTIDGYTPKIHNYRLIVPLGPPTKYSNYEKGYLRTSLYKDTSEAGPTPPKRQRLHNCFNVQLKGDVTLAPKHLSQVQFHTAQTYRGNGWYNWAEPFVHDGAPNQLVLTSDATVTVNCLPGRTYPVFGCYDVENTGSPTLYQPFYSRIGLHYCCSSADCTNPWKWGRQWDAWSYIYAMVYPYIYRGKAPNRRIQRVEWRYIYYIAAPYTDGSNPMIVLRGTSARLGAATYEATIQLAIQQAHRLAKSSFTTSETTRYVYKNSFYAQGEIAREAQDLAVTSQYLDLYNNLWKAQWDPLVEAGLSESVQDAILGERAYTGSVPLLLSKVPGLWAIGDAYLDLYEHADIAKVTAKDFSNFWLANNYGLRLSTKGFIGLVKAIKPLAKRWQASYTYSHGRRTFSPEPGVTVETNVSIAYRYFDERLLLMLSVWQSLGAIVSPSTIWDAIPYSFVLGWFFPNNIIDRTADYYDSLYTSTLLKQLRCCQSVKAEILISPSKLPFPVSPTDQSLLIGDDTRLVIYKREYSPMPPNPIPGLSLNNIDSSWNLRRILSGGSLILQRM